MATKSDKTSELELKIKDLEERWKRALADYQNLEKRVCEEKGELVKSASETLVVRLLPVLDNLEKAADHLKDEGLNLALRHFREVLAKEGLVRIETLGRDFNPAEMEAVDTVLGEEENKVRQEFRFGYKLNGKVIRFAQVQVEKREAEEEAEGKAKDELRKGDYM